MRTETRHKYEQEEVWFPLSKTVAEWDDGFHNLMLNDKLRMEAYEKAIKQTVKPGMNALDLGTGTGILALWALEAGASRVYGVDVNETRITQALARIKKAGFGNGFEIFQGMSYDVNLPESVDVLISEILGNLGDNEDMARILNDARTRFLKKDGIMLPYRCETFLVPVETKAYKQVKEIKVKSISGNHSIDDLLKDKENPFNMYYDCIIPERCYLSQPQQIQQFSFQGEDQEVYTVEKQYVVQRDGEFNGFKGYFIATLSDDGKEKVVLDISGENVEAIETTDCWKHCYLPVANPVSVEEGDVITLRFSRSYPEVQGAFSDVYGWEGEVIRKGLVLGTYRQQAL